MSGTTDAGARFRRSVLIGLTASVSFELDLIAAGIPEEQARQIVRELPAGALDRLESEIESRLDFSGISTKLGGDRES